MKRLLLIISLVLILILAAACAWAPTEVAAPAVPPPEPVAPAATEPEPPVAPEPETYVSFADYSGIFAALQEAQATMYGIARGGDGGLVMEEMAMEDAAEMPAEAPAPEPSPSAADADMEAGKSAADDYSGTNVQVEGIDEGDIVKTDGEYIYILRENEVIIVSAEGEDSRELGRFTVAESEQEDRSEYASEMYISGDVVAVLRTANAWNLTGARVLAGGKDWWEGTEVALYNVSDPTAVKEIEVFGQDGWYNTSRLYDDILYVVSNYYIYTEMNEDEPQTFVPSLYRDGKGQAIAAEDICICPMPSTSYVVITAIDLAKGELTADYASLGSCDVAYMNDSGLYILAAQYQEEVVESSTQSIYKVEKYESGTTTQILRFGLENGQISYEAGGQVQGRMINQFAVDEYQGYLRMVAMTDINSYTIYTDEEMGFVNYKWEDDSYRSWTSLYVLDEDMQVIGEVKDLAPDENVYSVRFDGDIGYFVTYKQIDPLFAVDLSEPTAPKVLSALKIPGFSQYLHVYGAGRLFGLGMETEMDGTVTLGMKLSMFDTSDPTDVREKSKLVLDMDYSAALYNHKAILINADRDLIGFPAERGYQIYGYTDEKGFYLRSDIQFQEDEWYWYYDGCRGLYVGDYFYICGYNGVIILSLADLSQVASVAF